jgi:hypothetical protein
MPPPPAGASSPLQWGTEDHVRNLFGDYVEMFKETFGPVIALYESLDDDAERAAMLDPDFLEFATRANRGATDGLAEYHYEYLLVIARRGNEQQT